MYRQPQGLSNQGTGMGIFRGLKTPVKRTLVKFHNGIEIKEKNHKQQGTRMVA